MRAKVRRCARERESHPTVVLGKRAASGFPRAEVARLEAFAVLCGARARYPTVVLGEQPLSGGGAAEVSRLGAAGPSCRDTATSRGAAAKNTSQKT